MENKIKKKFINLLLLNILIILGCPKNNKNNLVPPKPTPIIVDIDYCEQAEINLKKLKCIPSDKPYTKKGLSFKQFCEKKQNDGIFLNPKCLAIEVTEKTGCSYVDVCTKTADKPKE